MDEDSFTLEERKEEVETELSKAKKKEQVKLNDIAKMESQLSNDGFLSRAPEEIVRDMYDKLKDGYKELKDVKEEIDELIKKKDSLSKFH